MVFFKVPDRENEGKRGVCVDSIVCGKGIHLESSEWGWIWTFHGMKQTSKKTREARMRSSSQSRWMDGCNGFNLRLRVTTTTELPMTDATDRQTVSGLCGVSSWHCESIQNRFTIIQRCIGIHGQLNQCGCFVFLIKGIENDDGCSFVRGIIFVDVLN